jgi:hypothetical protein
VPAEISVSGPWCQRWKPGRVQSWRPASQGGFDPSRYEVAPLPEADAKAFVEARHYSGSYPAARLRYGLHEVSDYGLWSLVGVAVLSVPAQARVLTNVFPGLEPYRESLELGRFVLADEVPANGESWFLAQCWQLAARTGIRGVVSFSDPMRRTNAAGVVVFGGHLGIIYQASNAVYTGRGTERTLTVLRDGSVLSDRARSKILARDKGHEYAERRLIALGARAPRAGENPAAWLHEVLDDTGARRVRHKGCLRYGFTIGETRRQRLAVEIAPARLGYPKSLEAA